MFLFVFLRAKNRVFELESTEGYLFSLYFSNIGTVSVFYHSRNEFFITREMSFLSLAKRVNLQYLAKPFK